MSRTKAIRPGYINRADAAEMIGVHLNTMKAWTTSGKIPSEKVGNVWWIEEKVVKQYADAMRVIREGGGK